MKILYALMTLTLISPVALAGSTVDLPTGEEVLAQYVEATGGKAAYEKLTNRVSTGTFELAAANVKGKVIQTQAAPNKMLNVTDMGATGKTSQGTDGTLAWEISTFGGDRVLDGDEKETFLTQATFNSELKRKDLYAKIECVGTEDVEGKPAYKVVLTPKAGKPLVEFYDVKSHLMTKQTATVATPMGELKIDTFPGDYKKVDGVLMPMSARQKILTQEIKITFTDIKHNVTLPKDAFNPPAAIVEMSKTKK
jgi:hypothetical protein